MNYRDIILKLCELKNTNYATVAKKIGTTKQNIYNKFEKNKFYANDLENIADALDCDLEIHFVDKKTKKVLL